MVWQAVVLAVQILLLAAGWLLFQRARGELSVRAAEIPVLAEVKALQKSVKLLLAEIDTTADRQSLRIEQVCADAADILTEIDDRLRDAEEYVVQYEDRIVASGRQVRSSEDDAARSARAPYPLVSDRETVAPSAAAWPETPAIEADMNTVPAHIREAVVSRRETVFSLADSGVSAVAIARAERLSEGEVETLLGLRVRQ